jgi:hypothetical protein
MIGDLPKLAIGLIVVLLVSVIGLGIAQQGIDTVTFESTDEFCATKDTVVTMIDDAFGWFPMLILALIGGIAIAYVAKFMGWINF